MCAGARDFVVNGPAESHNFHVPSDVDWVRFSIEAGYLYRIETHHLATNADTLVYLYAANCSSLLAMDDNGGTGLGSLVEYMAPQTGVRYVEVAPASPARTGPHSDYQLSITRQLPGTTVTPTATLPSKGWLPLLRK